MNFAEFTTLDDEKVFINLDLVISIRADDLHNYCSFLYGMDYDTENLLIPEPRFKQGFVKESYEEVKRIIKNIRKGESDAS